MSASYNHGSSSIGRALFHFSFVPKYWHRIFVHGEIKSRCEALLRETAQRYGMAVHEVGFGADHVHLVVDISHRHSPSEAARLLKGVAARVLFQEFPWLRQRYFWGGHLWGPQYFYDSVGTNTYENVRRYVRNQEAS